MGTIRKDTPRRLDAYVRVSSTYGREGEKFTSPQDQDRAIRKWADLYGHVITDAGPDNGAWHELDKSGGTMDRPYLNEILARIDAGDSDGIVVYRLDRFGRTLVGALQIIERLHEDGKLFASVMDNFDISTENGRLVLRIMLSLAQYERERIQSTWKTARANAVERGWHVSGSRPFGYQREQLFNKKGEPYLGKLIVDPIEGPVVAELFKRRAAGESWSRLAKWLDSTGVPTSRGKTAWNTHVLQSVTRNRVYLGIASGGKSAKTGKATSEKHDAHPALTDPLTWQAAQQGAAPKRSARGAGHTALAMGLVRCSSCRYVTGVLKRHSTDESAHDYRCLRSQSSRDCPGPVNIVAYTPNGDPGLDDVIGEMVVDRLVAPVGFGSFDDVDGVDLDALEADWQTAQSRVDAHATNFDLEDQLGEVAFGKRGEALRVVAEDKLDALKRARDIAEREWVLGRSARVLADDWREGRLTLEEKRYIVANMVQTIFVRPAGPGGGGGDRRSIAKGARRLDQLRSRVHIVWAGEDPVDVPRQGRRDWEPKPFEFPV